MTKQPVLILGGRSDIGLAIAHEFAARGHPIQLAARNAASLDADRADIELRHGVSVTTHEFDVLDPKAHDGFIDQLPSLPEIAVCAVGVLGDQREAETDPGAASLIMRSNYEGPALVLAALARRFADRSSGTLVGISSVAGDRGRAKNFVYGSAKAGFTAFLSGLRNRYCAQGVHVVTVLPGFVYTRMTEGMPLPAALTAQPQTVARSVERAVRRGQDIVYTPVLWRLVMFIIRSIPERLFKKMDL